MKIQLLLTCRFLRIGGRNLIKNFNLVPVIIVVWVAINSLLLVCPTTNKLTAQVTTNFSIFATCYKL